MSHKLVATLGSERILIVDTHRSLVDHGSLESGDIGKMLVIESSIFAARLTPCGKLFQLHEEDGSLQGVQPAIQPYPFMEVLGVFTMHTKLSEPCRKLVIIGETHACISHCAEVFAGEKGQSPDVSIRATHLSFEGGTYALCIIFYNLEIMFLCYLHDTRHIAALSKEMHRHDGLCIRRDSGLDLIRIEVEGIFIDIYKHGDSTIAPDGRSRGKESERRGDNLIAMANIQCLDRQDQSIRSRGTADCMLDAQIVLHLCFEFFNLRAHDIMMLLKNFVYFFANILHQGLILRM